MKETMYATLVFAVVGLAIALQLSLLMKQMENQMNVTMTRAWIITQVNPHDGMATAVRKTSTYYANLDAALEAHGQNFIKWSDDTIEIEIPKAEEAVTEPF